MMQRQAEYEGDRWAELGMTKQNQIWELPTRKKQQVEVQGKQKWEKMGIWKT